MRLHRRESILIAAALLWCIFAAAGYLWYSHSGHPSTADDGNYQPYKVTSSVGPGGETTTSYYHNGMVCTNGPGQPTATCTNGE